MLSSSRSVWTCGALLVALAAAEALSTACSAVGGENASGVGPFDAGSSADSGAPDGTTDGGPEAGVGDTGAVDGATPPTTALFVQGSPSLPDVRLCWATSSGVVAALPFPASGHMPGSNYPGVPLGGAAAMSDATALIGPGVTVYAVDAENLARIEQGQTSPATCESLICGPGSNPAPDCLRYDLDYWPVSTIATGGVRGGSDNVVALGGCLASALDPAASAAVCGPDWTPLAGNLHADVLQLSALPPGAGIPVQAAQLSAALAIFEGDGGHATLSFGAQGSDAGLLVASLAGEGDLGASTEIVFDAGLAGYGELGFALDVAGDDGGAGHLWMSLAEAQQLVDPTEDPAVFFGQRRPYLIAVLGDPRAPHAFAPTPGDAGYDGKGLHVVVIAAPTPDAGPAEAGTPVEAGPATEAGSDADAGAGDP